MTSAKVQSLILRRCGSLPHLQVTLTQVATTPKRIEKQKTWLQKHRRRRTTTHMLLGGDFNAQVGANDEPEAIASNHIGRHAFGEHSSRGQWLRHWAVQHQLTLANTFFKKHNKATATLPCSNTDEDTTGQIDMNRDHKAVSDRQNRTANRPHDSTDPTFKEKESKDAQQRR